MRTLIFAFFLALTLSACGGGGELPAPECAEPVEVHECGVSTCSICSSRDGTSRAISGCDVFFGDRSSGAAPFHCVAACTDCP